MKQFLLVLALVVGFAAPAMAGAGGYPNIYADTCEVGSGLCR
jgi:hypothetical protein